MGGGKNSPPDPYASAMQMMNTFQQWTQPLRNQLQPLLNNAISQYQTNQTPGIVNTLQQLGQQANISGINTANTMQGLGQQANLEAQGLGKSAIAQGFTTANQLGMQGQQQLGQENRIMNALGIENSTPAIQQTNALQQQVSNAEQQAINEGLLAGNQAMLAGTQENAQLQQQGLRDILAGIGTNAGLQQQGFADTMAQQQQQYNQILGLANAMLQSYGLGAQAGMAGVNASAQEYAANQQAKSGMFGGLGSAIGGVAKLL
ncbi:MAG: hypothetical protein QW575_07940 [Thermoproteota archaeon]